ncbi:MAG: HAD-IIA family hydrolase [Anaerolineaceae bacterium]
MLIDKFPQVRGLILDMDGVVWHDSEPIGDLPEIFKGISDMDLKVVFATNNATKTVGEYQEKLLGFGVKIQPEQIITSAEAAANYLKAHFPQGSYVYVVGSPSLKRVILHKGFQVASEEDFQLANMVVVGLDTSITYDRIRNAALLVRSGAPFIATNADATYPTPQGLYPGAGTMVSAIATASGQEPLVIGKPFTAMYEHAFEVLGTTPEQTFGIGDRLETDVASAQSAGCLAGLVLSGVSTLEEASLWSPAPDLIAKDLSDLLYG